MPLDALLLALGSAVLHAGWNYWVKTSDDRLIAMWGVYTAMLVAGSSMDRVTEPRAAW